MVDNNIDIDAELGMLLNFLREKLQKDRHHVWFEYHNSIISKRRAVHLFGEEVINQIPQFVKEHGRIKTDGYSSVEQSTILLIRYQAFLNIIYALCENLAFLATKFIPNLSRSYNTQISKKTITVLKEKYPLYAEVLEKNVWYEDMHVMRSEATHYFDGLVWINSSERPGILFQRMVHSRDGVGLDTKIDIPDIETHVNELIQGVDDYLKNLCDFLSTLIEEDSEMHDMCWIDIEGERGLRVFGPKVKTFSEYRNGSAWRCKTQFPCILEKTCPFIGDPSTVSTNADKLSKPDL